MLKWLDNFEGYVANAATPVPANSYLYQNYSRWGTNVAGNAPYYTINNIAAQPENRICLNGVGASNTGLATQTWALSKDLSKFLANSNKLWIGFRLLRFTASFTNNNIGQFGLAHVQGTTFRGLLIKVGFINKDTLSVSWTDENNAVVVRTYNLAQPIFGTSDYVEVMLDKTGDVAIWLNNRIIFAESIFPTDFPVGEMHWVVLGSLHNKEEGSPGPYVQTGLPLPEGYLVNFGLTDLYAVNEEAGINTGRLGRVRVTGRVSAGDAGPNDWTPYAGSTEPTHAAIVANIPPDPAKYLTTNTELAAEMYAGLAFPSLGSEEVIGMMVRVMASKQDPMGPDIKTTIASGSTTVSGALVPLTSSPTYINEIWETNPATGARWLASAVNNSRFGFTAET